MCLLAILVVSLARPTPVPAPAPFPEAISVYSEPRQGRGERRQAFFLDVWPGEEGGWGQLGQFQRHLVGGGVNHLGGRWGGVGCGFSGPGDPCGERNTGLDFVVFWLCFEGTQGGGGL